MSFDTVEVRSSSLLVPTTLISSVYAVATDIGLAAEIS